MLLLIWSLVMSATVAVAQPAPAPAPTPNANVLPPVLLPDATADMRALFEQIGKVCPQAVSLHVVDLSDKQTWTIRYQDGATCQSAAQAVLDAFTPQQPAQ